jgi:Zn-dependent protease
MLNLSPATLISRLITLVIALTFHEFAHAWTATRYGDDTPYLFGRLTLNPLRHLDLLGSMMLIFVGFGWAKPVPVNPSALERRSHTAYLWVSLAGPFSNFLLALVASVIFRLLVGGSGGWASYFLLEFIYINLLLWVFNLIPIPPLDGEKLVSYLLPSSAAPFYEKYRQFGPLLLIALVVLMPLLGFDLFGSVISPIINQLTMFLIGA